MKIFSWNVRGLGGLKKHRLVKANAKKCDTDIIIFQTTKKETFPKRLLTSVSNPRIDEWFFLLASGISGGILIARDSLLLSKKDAFIRLFSVSIIFSIIESGWDWMLIGVCGPT